MSKPGTGGTNRIVAVYFPPLPSPRRAGKASSPRTPSCTRRKRTFPLPAAPVTDPLPAQYSHDQSISVLPCLAIAIPTSLFYPGVRLPR